jgi:ABC-type Fe3+-hydroxamate transport system substrate-binding protein
VIKAYQDRIAAVKAVVSRSRLASMPYGIAFKRIIQGNLKLFGPNSYAGRMLVQVGAAGIIDPGNIDPDVTGEFGENFPVERLNALAGAEALLLIAHPVISAGESITDLPTWRTLPVTSSGRVFDLRRDIWYIETVMTRMRRLDDIEQLARQLT